MKSLDQFNIQSLLAHLVEKFRLLLGENLVGVYLHGSLAMGCFNPRTSDVDFIVVVSEKLDVETKKAIIAFVLEPAKDAPAKGLEFSVVLLNETQHVTYPTPYELHYSEAWREVYQSGQADYETPRRDPDLAAHFVMVRRRGICLYGRPIDEVFAEGAEAYYWASIANDARDILGKVAENPVYSILNLCRVLAFKRERLITSKAEGGSWGLANLDPQYHPLIRQALHEYAAADPMNVAWDKERLDDFAEYVSGML
jgi:predicted nucleotidyltransferase